MDVDQHFSAFITNHHSTLATAGADNKCIMYYLDSAFSYWRLQLSQWQPFLSDFGKLLETSSGARVTEKVLKDFCVYSFQNGYFEDAEMLCVAFAAYLCSLGNVKPYLERYGN